MKKGILVLLAAVCIVAVGLRLSKISARQGVPIPLERDAVRPGGRRPNGGVPVALLSSASRLPAQAGVPPFQAAIVQSMNSIRLVAPPIIDGHSTDWPFGNAIELNRATAYLFGGKIDSLADLSAVIRSGWDDEKLYFLIEVTDEKIVADSNDVWRDDGVEIGLDGLHDQYAWGWDDHQYGVVVDGRKTDRVTPITNIAAAVLQYQGGYNIEVAIPVSQLIPGTPVSGTVMGFTIGLHDDDDGGNYDGYLIWQGPNTSSSPEEFGSLIFIERSEDRLIALEARIAKLEDRIRELLVVLAEFEPLTLPTLSAPSETPTATVTPVTPTLVQTATPSRTPTLGPSSTPTPTTSGPSRTPTPTTSAVVTPSPTPSATATGATRTPTYTPTRTVTMTPGATDVWISPTPTLPGAETTVTLQQGSSGYLGCDDTYIYQYAPNGNYCTENLIKVGSNQQYAGLVRFDVSAIPRNAVVTRAALQMYMAGWGGLDTTLGVSFILRTVTACEATWNQAQNGNPWGQSGCNSTTTDRRSVMESTVKTSGVSKWYTFTLSSAVQSWVDGSLPNNGLLLRATYADFGANLLFASAQNSDVNSRPRLVITYHVPSGPTPTATTTPFLIIGHITDDHVGKEACADQVVSLVSAINGQAHVLIDTGDCTDNGTAAESIQYSSLVNANISLPWRAIAGNHDTPGPFTLYIGPMEWSWDIRGYRLIGINSEAINYTALDAALTTEKPCIIFGHYPLYEYPPAAQEALRQRFKAYGVPLYVSGHDHVDSLAIDPFSGTELLIGHWACRGRYRLITLRGTNVEITFN